MALRNAAGALTKILLAFSPAVGWQSLGHGRISATGLPRSSIVGEYASLPTWPVHRSNKIAMLADDEDDEDDEWDLQIPNSLPRLTTPEEDSFRRFRERRKAMMEKDRLGPPERFGSGYKDGYQPRSQTPVGTDPVHGIGYNITQYMEGTYDMSEESVEDGREELELQLRAQLRGERQALESQLGSSSTDKTDDKPKESDPDAPDFDIPSSFFGGKDDEEDPGRFSKE